MMQMKMQKKTQDSSPKESCAIFGQVKGDCYKMLLFTLDHLFDFINNFRVSQCHNVTHIAFV